MRRRCDSAPAVGWRREAIQRRVGDIIVTFSIVQHYMYLFVMARSRELALGGATDQGPVSRAVIRGFKGSTQVANSHRRCSVSSAAPLPRPHLPAGDTNCRPLSATALERSASLIAGKTLEGPPKRAFAQPSKRLGGYAVIVPARVDQLSTPTPFATPRWHCLAAVIRRAQTRAGSQMTSTRAGPGWASASPMAPSSSPRSVTRTPCAPHSSAKAAKDGFTSDVCQTPN